MKNIFFTILIIGFICFLPACKDPCKNVISGYIFPVANQFKKYSFKPGSYWIYQDSASGIIDSQSVYYYSAQNHVSIDNQWSDGIDCIVYGDVFSMSVASFWNGVLHDSIFYSTNGDVVFVSQSNNPDNKFYYSAEGSNTDTLINVSVSGQTYPKVYLDPSNYYPLIYHVDYVGVVKWVFNDSINGQHTWNLLRYHVINP